MKKHNVNALRALVAAGILAIILLIFPARAFAAEREDYSDCLWYSQLNTEGARFAYARLTEALDALEEEVYFPESTGCTEADIRAAFDAISNDLPEYFYVLHFGVNEDQDGSGYVAKLSWGLGYRYATKEEVTQAKQEVEHKIEAFLVSVPSDIQTDYEKALYVHDYLANTISYGWGIDPQSIYGALVEGKCVCAGYANAYTVLMRRLGVKTWYIEGVANGERHAWNVSWIDGKCAYTDVTWDDLNPGVRYKYFNLNREEMEQNHTPDDKFLSVLPEETAPVVTEPAKETVPAETAVPTTPSVTVPTEPSEATQEAKEPTEPPVDTNTNGLTQATEPFDVESSDAEAESSDSIDGSFIATLLCRVCLSLVIVVLNSFGIHV